MKRLSLLFVSALILSSAASAQHAEFLHLTPRDGLSDGFVWPILQTQDGYMWFGTTAGLDRFDGYTVGRFMHDPSDETSIRQGTVHTLLEAPDGTLWIGTATGLSRLDRQTLRFENIDLDATLPSDSLWVMQTFALHRSGDGTMWAGTGNGLYSFPEGDPTEVRHFQHDPDDPASIGSSRIHVIEEDARGSLWLGTHQDGLLRFDPSSGKARHFRHDPAERRSLSSDFIWDLHFDRNGQLWIGTSHGGLCRFEAHTESFSCYRHDSANPRSLSGDHIQSIFEDDEGHLWLGTHGGGISILDRRTETFTAYRHDPAHPASLAEDDVHRIYRDRFGTMWFAHHNRGLSRMTPGRVHFSTERPAPDAAPNAPSNLISDVVELNGVLWTSTGYGLLRHDVASGAREHFLPHPEVAPSVIPAGNRNFLSTIVPDDQGRLWLGTSVGSLLLFDPRERQFRTIDTPEHDTWVEPAEVIAGDLWVMVLDKGIWRVDTATEALTEYLPDPDVPGSLLGEIALPYLSEDGTIWIAGYAGQDFSRPLFQRYDPQRDAFDNVKVSLPTNNQYNYIFMFPERPGEFWIDSASGPYRVNASTGAVRAFPRHVYGVPPGLRAMVRDDQDRYWFGTWTGGFGVFDPRSGTTTSYYPQDGLDLSRYVAARQMAAGEFIFAGFGGYVRFRPDEVLRSGSPPRVLITGMHAGGSAFDSAEGHRLAHDQNTVAFDYVALHFADPARNQYRYMLEGFDDDWNRVGTQRAALYPRLPPGRYTFRVQAASSDGTWNEEGAFAAFTILPPWWRTWWAYGFYVLMLGGGVIGVDRVQRRRLVARERERARERELEHAREIERAYERLKAAQAQLVQQEKLASLGALTAGIAHEIKNPLNFVNNFAHLTEELASELSEDVAAGRSPEELEALIADIRANATKIAEHGRRADGIVRSMLEHSRGTKGERQPTDLNALVEEYVNLAFHGMRAQKPDFQCTVEKALDPALPPAEVVPQEVGRVLLNLLSNAFQAVHDRRVAASGADYRPMVEVVSKSTRQGIQIRIRDNGTGIPEHVKHRIFEPFFTTKAAGEGTGLGLSLSHEIVTQGHGGSLTVESEVGSGSEFIVEVPLRGQGGPYDGGTT